MGVRRSAQEKLIRVYVPDIFSLLADLGFGLALLGGYACVVGMTRLFVALFVCSSLAALVL